ncbi:UNVERIFIED_ORG: transporter substrate-binding domain-containing protein [Shinella sp. XGS7]|nr:transporter substrate-binding domain-containing protein [Shinella sp. XGS7]
MSADEPLSGRRRWLLRHLPLGLSLSGLGLRARAQALPRVTVLLEEFPPYALRGADGGPEGFAVDLTRELLARARVEAVFEFNSWPRVLQRAREQPQVLIPAIVRLPERETQFLWVAQISLRRGTLYRLRSRPDVQVRELADARRYLTGVIKGDVSERELVALGLQPGEHLDASADYTVLLRKFFAGRVQLVALNSLLMAATLQRHGYQAEDLEPVLRFSSSRPSIALSLGSDERLVRALRQAWESMRRDGSAAAISARHGMLLP